MTWSRHNALTQDFCYMYMPFRLCRTLFTTWHSAFLVELDLIEIRGRGSVDPNLPIGLRSFLRVAFAFPPVSHNRPSP